MFNRVNAFKLVALVGFIGCAHANQESATLSVKGTIIPAACTPSFSGDGTVDFGKLQFEDFNELKSKEVTLTVGCTAPASFLVSFTDNRPDDGTTGNEYFFGLGKQDENPIGYYIVDIPEVIADGELSGVVSSPDKITWAMETAMKKVNYHSISKDNESPEAAQNVSFRLSIMPTLNYHILNYTKEVVLDGSMTATISYL